MMQLGPASVEAVRKGELGLGYDVDFVFAEVIFFFFLIDRLEVA